MATTTSCGIVDVVGDAVIVVVVGDAVVVVVVVVVIVGMQRC